MTLLLLGLLAAASPVWAAQPLAAPSIEQLAQRADIVVIGEVSSAAGEWAAGRSSIQTRVALTVAELLKGTAPSPLTFTQLGGRVGNEASAIGGGPGFQPGERVLVFLTRRPDGSLRLADLIYGKFEIVRDAATGRDQAVRATGAVGADQVDLDQVRTLVRRSLGGRTDPCTHAPPGACVSPCSLSSPSRSSLDPRVPAWSFPRPTMI